MTTIGAIGEALEATVLAGEDLLGSEIGEVYASDLMSDVLAFGKPDSILLTGLTSQQSLISAYMAEFKGVVLIRGKRPKEGAERFAAEHNLALLSSKLDMYDACVRINELRRGSPRAATTLTGGPEADSLPLRQQFSIEGGDFAKAGMVSTEVKSLLKQIGIDPTIVRRVAISTYEAEMNVHMHARRARVDLSVHPKLVEVIVADEGKGIPDVNQAMQEGFTTATEEQRAMGFGSGMGLPNIKKNSDELDIQSRIGEGTLLIIRFFLPA